MSMKTETITEKLRRTKAIDNDFDYERAQNRHQRLEEIDPSTLANAEEDEYLMLDDCLLDFEKRRGKPPEYDKFCPKCKASPYNPEDPFGLCEDCGEDFEAEENERNLNDESTRGIVG